MRFCISVAYIPHSLSSLKSATGTVRRSAAETVHRVLPRLSPVVSESLPAQSSPVLPAKESSTILPLCSPCFPVFSLVGLP